MSTIRSSGSVPMTQVMQRLSADAQILAEPEAEIRNIVSTKAASVGRLPPAKALELYYVRGVGNSKYSGGLDQDVVVYGPEFVYLLDVGFPAFCGVTLPYFVSGNGDPGFPRYSEATVVSIQARTRSEVIFPVEIGTLLIGTKRGTTLEQLTAEVGSHADNVRPVTTDLYTASVKPFHEQQIAKQIEQSAQSVRYASLNRILRIIDFKPGWLVDRIC